MILINFIGSLVSLIGDVFLKKAATKNNFAFLVLGIVIYSISSLVWFYLYKSNKFAIVTVVYSIITILLSVGIGFYYFKEKLSNIEIIGIVLAVFSLILLTRRV